MAGHSEKPETSEVEFDYRSIIAFNQLGVRAQNALLVLFSWKLPSKPIIKEHFIDQDFDPKKLRNVGKKTASEILDFAEKTIALYHQTQNEEPSPEKFAIYKVWTITGVNIQGEHQLIEDFIAGRFPIITFLIRYQNQLMRLDELDTFIFKNHFRMLDEFYPNDFIGIKFGFSAERARQKKTTLLEKFSKVVDKSAPLLPYSTYQLWFRDKNLLEVPKSINITDLQMETELAGVFFSSYVLSQLLKDNYFLLDPYQKFPRPRSGEKIHYLAGKHKLQGFYLVNHRELPKKTLLTIYQYVMNHIYERKKQDMVVELNSIVSEKITPKAEKIIQTLLLKEFQLTMQYGKIHFPRTAKKRIYEYAWEAMEATGKPAYISEIKKVIKTKYHDFSTNDSALKAAIIKEKEVFIFISKTGLYGLKKWEKTDPTLKGGTIRDIAEEYLKGFTGPQPVKAVIKHVKKFRKTKCRTIDVNLRMTKYPRFVFYEGGYIGLAAGGETPH